MIKNKISKLSTKISFRHSQKLFNLFLFEIITIFCIVLKIKGIFKKYFLKLQRYFTFCLIFLNHNCNKKKLMKIEIKHKRQISGKVRKKKKLI